ncbi:106aa long hypothetical protein [Pyrococcus horikoshii OT3]|uniref:Uncharacterized protein n=1 Tax=Pyrococcus horikoshii (strain ATCC 700860 / DSM 12428 / JCM 9974 / NBRC 100139 / OT-3) TaxID=70601 RepID=O58985_PYRHO|nr:106aa long hypothetical protein [Pyrococcus horikoshii OT3]
MKVPIGASGSSTMITRLFTLSLNPSIFKGGFMSTPSHVYLAGINSLFPKTELTLRDIFSSPPPIHPIPRITRVARTIGIKDFIIGGTPTRIKDFLVIRATKDLEYP